MRDFLQPLFQKILEAITVETVEDWACCLTDISVRNCVLTIRDNFNVSGVNNVTRQIVIHDVFTGCLRY